MLRYLDGRVVKDDTITRPGYSRDGGAGNELDSVDVKSGTTRQTFGCTRTNRPPAAMLEIQTPAGGFPFSGIVYRRPGPLGPCGPDRTTGQIQWPYADPELQFRRPTDLGTSSGDPDGDIVSWSIDFGNDTQASGSRNSRPPGGVSHAYPCSGGYPPPLIVIDSAGESDTDTGFLDVAPD